MINITSYNDKYKDDIIKLVLHCQNDGTRPIVDVSGQQDLLDINNCYFKNGGFFWTALNENKLAGTIGLMNYGNGIGMLKKFFVYEEYRGEPYHLGQKLYSTLLDFAYKNNFKEIYLDTPKNTIRAHKFYKKAGFVQILQDSSPIKFNLIYSENDFFKLSL